MAVHVPLSKAAVSECREIMLSSNNLLSPSSGEPSVAPTLDIVLGCYYLTTVKPGSRGEGKTFSSFGEAELAYSLGAVDLRADIKVRDLDGKLVQTSVGRIIFNEALPDGFGFFNHEAGKSELKELTTKCINLYGNQSTAEFLDRVKQLGFHYATQSGITIAMNDIEVPKTKAKLLGEAEEKIALIERDYNRGLTTDEDRYNLTVQVWNETMDRLTETISQSLDRYGGVYMMVVSGAKGNIAQIKQMAGMRGLMTDPSGRIIDFPIRSSFREGLTALEYFISTHGARKGLTDTALRTSDSGYLTRRLIDIAQDVLATDEDCGTASGIWIGQPAEKGLLAPMEERIMGRLPAQPITHPQTGEVLVDMNELITPEKAAMVAASGVTHVYVRSPLSCLARKGMCQRCYGQDMGRGQLVAPKTALGIIAAQSIGEPGTQLTMRTFHTGGVVGLDITSGLPRVEELFEARSPKGEALIPEIDGVVEVEDVPEGKLVRIISAETYRQEYPLPPGWKAKVKKGSRVEVGTILAQPAPHSSKSKESKESKASPPALPAEAPLVARVAGVVGQDEDRLYIDYEERDERTYQLPATARLRVVSGARVRAGDQLTEGHINPQDVLRIMGREAVQRYLVDEVQRVYRSQGVDIHDKHIEVIVRQMLTKVSVESSGDTELLPGELVDHFDYEDINAKVLAEGGEPATAQPVILGITRASLSTNSWLAAASFQETTRVLTEAAIWGKTDKLSGLKENVIIGKLIPAQAIIQPLPSKIAIAAQKILSQERAEEATAELSTPG
ncbi:MAG: DNA-directed RNA polymerase subunit beta', partial [Chloroflexota bacterium]